MPDSVWTSDLPTKPVITLPFYDPYGGGSVWRVMAAAQDNVTIHGVPAGRSLQDLAWVTTADEMMKFFSYGTFNQGSGAWIFLGGNGGNLNVLSSMGATDPTTALAVFNAGHWAYQWNNGGVWAYDQITLMYRNYPLIPDKRSQTIPSQREYPILP